MDTPNRSLKIPYSPSLALLDSYVAIYKIYVLRNPLKDNEIFYVGQTMMDLKVRLSGHIGETGANRGKINYIKSILDAGSKPIIEAIEVIKTTCYIDKMMVNEREYYWIRYYLSSGCNLLNSAGTAPGSQNNHYNGYLSALKRGETHWHWYYCGKTAGGYEVYDAEKLKLDGFQFPKSEPPKESECEFQWGNPNYHPFEYLKFNLKSGIPHERYRRPVVTQIFPEEPAWTAEFFKGIYEQETDFNEFEDDWSDPDLEMEYDSEPDVDDEPDGLIAWDEEPDRRKPVIKYFGINDHLLNP